MSYENKVASLATVIATTISVIAILIGSGIGWGIIQTRVTALEARADACQKNLEQKLDRDYYYEHNHIIQEELKSIKSDLKLILQKLR